MSGGQNKKILFYGCLQHSLYPGKCLLAYVRLAGIRERLTRKIGGRDTVPGCIQHHQHQPVTNHAVAQGSGIAAEGIIIAESPVERPELCLRYRGKIMVARQNIDLGAGLLQPAQFFRQCFMTEDLPAVAKVACQKEHVGILLLHIPEKGIGKLAAVLGFLGIVRIRPVIGIEVEIRGNRNAQSVFFPQRGEDGNSGSCFGIGTRIRFAAA